MMDRIVPVALLLAGLLFHTAFPAIAEAAPPAVRFDMPLAIACQDVTPPEFAATSPGVRLIEARFEVSTLIAAGKEEDLTQVLIRIVSPKGTLTIADYLPKTLHESRMAGPITIQKTDEASATLGINLAGKYELLTGATADIGLAQKSAACAKYDLLPPLETVAASGTIVRGTGVFFKRKASPRNLLEGSAEYAVVLRVPQDWRADYVHVRCEAEGIERSFVSSLNETVACGQRDFLVGLYLEGDEGARTMAEGFARRAKLPGSPSQVPLRGSVHRSASVFNLLPSLGR